jgi:hypothetical protein
MSSIESTTAISKPNSVIDGRKAVAPIFLGNNDVRQNSMSDNISFPHWSAHRMKKFIIIWLDPKIDELDSDYQNSISQLRQIVGSTKIFTVVEQCTDFIMETDNAKFFLILSDEIGETVMPLIHDTPQLDSILVFCTNDIKYEPWMSEWKKIEGIFSNISSICDELRRNIKHCEQHAIPLNIISTSSTVDMTERDQSLMYSQLLTEILLEMNYKKAAKREFLELCRKQYEDNTVQLRRIDDFERNYELHSALWWYIKKNLSS